MTSADLRFYNEDATPKEVRMFVPVAAIPEIVTWYSAYHSGDDVAVFIDGRKMALDHNGEIVGKIA